MARSNETKRWFLSVSIFSPEKRKLSTHFHSYSQVASLQHSIKYKGKLTRMLMHLNDSHIIANIYFTTKDKSCESVYERKTTDGVTTT